MFEITYVDPETNVEPTIVLPSDVDNDDVDVLFLYIGEDVEESMLITKVLEPGSVAKVAPTIGRPSAVVGADGDCEVVAGGDEEAAAGSAGAVLGSGSQLLVAHGGFW